MQLPDWKPCPRIDVDCPQGMVLEIDPCCPSGEWPELPRIPKQRYRCQDCDLEEDVTWN